ncbi:MAG: Ig-like domain-containing protein [Ignavibacteriales bacterium]|nr:Ig-like domain-containing protein [Ignavibacteriales bacterium]
MRWGIFSALLLLVSCQNPEGPSDNQPTTTPTQVKGSVLRNDNLAPVANAIVYDLGGLAKDTSKTDGSFLLKYQLTSRYIGKVVASRVGFGNDTVNVVLNPGVDTTITLRVKADSSSPIGGISSGKAANIVLVGTSGENISIRGTGANETAILTFEVRDSLGVTVGGTNKVRVNFSILGGPGGGEYIFPPSADTDPLTGRVTTRVSSGTKAGVLQVYASATPVTGVTIKSSPIRLTISGGLPIAERFSISREKANIAGGVFDGLRAKISVIVGDKEGNPVQTGTAVSFTTTGGIIQPSATTDKDGLASVELISANPRPTNGIAIVTAKTIGDSGVTISRNIPVLFSGVTRIIAPSTTFEIPDSGEFNFAYKIQDGNGNPLVGGSVIAVTTSGPGAANLVVEGDGSVTLPDTDDPSYTNFSVKVRDTKTGGASGPASITITVTSQNGNKVYKFDGNVKGQDAVIGLPPSVRKPAQIAFINATSSNVFVQGVGALENTVLTYEVRDSLGSPIDTSQRSFATYSVNFAPNSYVAGGTGPRIIPTGGYTDDKGRLQVSLSSGTKAGVAQIVITINLGGSIIQSQPVVVVINAGFPEQAHFSLAPAQFNFPGIDRFFVQEKITAQVVDKYSNPVKAGTAVYFNTSHGSIQTSAALTDVDGFVSKTLFSSNPYPEGANVIPSLGAAFSKVYARTIGENGVNILDSLVILWTGMPIFTKTDLINTFVVPQGGAAGPFTFTILDRYGHPMSAGTTITVSGNGLTVNGQATTIMPDTQVGGAGITSFTVNISDPDPTDTAPPVASILTVTVSHPVYGVFTYILATGTVD